MTKTFDAVAFQRRVRQELGEKYLADPEAFRNEMILNYHQSKKK